MKRILLTFLALLPCIAFAEGGERVLSYDSHIKVSPAGDMLITETIKVVCGGDKTVYDVYRDFPTRYKDKHNNTLRVDLDFQSALIDGKPDQFESLHSLYSERVYMGRKSTYRGSGKDRKRYLLPLEPGEHTFVLTYQTDRQVSSLGEYDELYWNVSGDVSGLAIEKVSATVELPTGAEVLSTEAYTGSDDEKGTDFVVSRDGHGRTVLSTTRPLNPYESLAIVAKWPKGFVQEPTEAEKNEPFVAEWGSTIAGAVGIVALLIYYLFVWLKVGRDPHKGVIAPLHEAPEGFSPAAVRYVKRMGFDNRAFAAALVSMAVKGFITIGKDTNGGYKLTWKGEDYNGLPRDEKRIAKGLFYNDTTVAIETGNHAIIKQALHDLQQSLAMEYEKIYFLANKGALIPGLVISFIALSAIVILGGDRYAAVFMGIWVPLWAVACVLMVKQSFKEWRAAKTAYPRRVSNFIRAFFTTMVTLFFLMFEVLALYNFAEAVSMSAFLCFITILLLNVLFYHLMKAPTIKGRSVMDQIEGLKLYLAAVAEKDRPNVQNPPEKTPEVFEKLLPYAVALGVEQQWCEQFSGALAQASDENGYMPQWCMGSQFAEGGVAELASNLGAMLSSISLSASPPAKGRFSVSSSGGGGGGWSGGGGGGGGGGSSGKW